MEASGSRLNSLMDQDQLRFTGPPPDQDLRPDPSLHQDHPGVQEEVQEQVQDLHEVQDLQEVQEQVQKDQEQFLESQQEVQEGDSGLSLVQVVEWASADGAHLPDQDQYQHRMATWSVSVEEEPGDTAPPHPPDLALLPPTSWRATDLSLSSCGEAGDLTSCDLLSLRSDSLSLTSEAAASRRSEEDDTRSVAASSVMSLFHRIHLEPLEKDWLTSSALGNLERQHQLLDQEPGLVFKKDFITGFTALHWAAKHGRQDALELMLRFGANINVRSHGGYTALHLASIHGHQQLVHSLIHFHNAKTNIRDYHGKVAAHYWSGSRDVFHKADAPTGGRLLRGRRSQRSLLPSLLLTRSHSQGHFNLELRPLPQSSSQQALDLHL